jgi:hypothetical protein
MKTRSARTTAAVAMTIALTVGLAPPTATGAGPVTEGPAALTERAAMARDLGTELILQLDPSFGTVRMLARLDGSLTAPSQMAPQRITLAFVRDHREALGLTQADLETLALRRDYVDVLGTHHLSWTQRARGLDAFQVGLEAAVTADGRLMAISGPIARGLAAPGGRFRLARDDALAAARSAAGVSARVPPSAIDSAERVLFPTPNGTQLAWKTRVFVSPKRVDLTVVNGRTGDVLWRRNTVINADQVGSGLAWPYYPSQTIPNGGGVQTPVTFPVADAAALSGNNAHVFTDVRARFARHPRPQDEVAAVDPGTLSWTSPAVLEDGRPKQNCTPDWNCTWDSKEAFSWRVNRRASATNTYWLLNHFHDHLEAAPIGFTEAAGNFQVVNDDGQGGLDGDPMNAHVLFGARGRDGFPDFVNNAFIAPTPDGEPAHMATFLFRKEDYGPEIPFGPGFPSSDAGVDALIVYHEYTHGLSHRLVTYPDGEPALGTWESASMGEAWSDWYALDLLDAEGYAGDGPGVDLPVGEYSTGGVGIRFQYADCLVDSAPADCPEPVLSEGAGPGGFTYGDMGHIIGFPEVHTDGEIWLQTLWELRGVLGHGPTVRLVTRAMELSPPQPSFLDMRNSILLADTIWSGGANHDDIWNVFAGRGMGFFAETNGGRRRHENFSLPVECPGGIECGRLQGTVVDADTDSGGQTGLPVEASATTAADGTYAIDVPNHEYGRVFVDGPGYLSRRYEDVRVGGTSVLDADLVRNWTQLDGGATITRVIGEEHPSDTCPPDLALDGDTGTSWQTRWVGDRRPSVTVRFPQAVDLGSIAIGPRSCEGRVRFFLREFTLFTRQDGQPWVKAIVNDRSLLRRRNPLVRFGLDLGRRNVATVRLVLRGSEPGGDRSVVGLAELRAFGTPA